MGNKHLEIKESCFFGSNTVKVKNYGELFDPWWGYDTIELTQEDVRALLEGKVLESSVAAEYGVLIRMK